jgi:hypothetical protein
MSNAIQFLEDLRRNPVITDRSTRAYAEKVEWLELDPALRRALLDCDLESLRDLLGGREKMLCMVATPDEGDSQGDFEESFRDTVH